MRLAFLMLLAPSLTRITLAEEFPVPAPLRPAVGFWIDVFTRYSRQDLLIHDRAEPWRVYAVVRDGDPAALEAAMRTARDRLALAGALEAPPMLPLLQLSGAPPVWPLPIERRLRVQRGMREEIMWGLLQERRWRPVVSRVLEDQGLPLGLGVLPIIESSYNPRAVSSAGAVGMWQLLAATADPYLVIARGVDERRNPERATEAAAHFLRELREQLPSWPLAITAYNHGPGGVQRGMRATGSTDLGVLVSQYHGPGFGFASRNYYAEFLAVLHVSRRVSGYFPEIAPDRIIEYEVRRGDTLSRVAHRHGVTVPKLLATNGLRSTRIQTGQRLFVRL